MASTLDTSRLQEVFDSITAASPGRLTDWEEDFVDSIYDVWYQNGSLTERQLEVLEKIYLKV
jgi:hypothetical protein